MSYLFFFYIVSDDRERERLLHFYGRRSIGVHVNRDGLLCVGGDSRETDRNQADVTVRKVRGANVRGAYEEREVEARISYACEDKV